MQRAEYPWNSKLHRVQEGHGACPICEQAAQVKRRNRDVFESGTRSFRCLAKLNKLGKMEARLAAVRQQAGFLYAAIQYDFTPFRVPLRSQFEHGICRICSL